jgi:sucrose-6-phosphate hydrolase SacC (GH32 family)
MKKQYLVSLSIILPLLTWKTFPNCKKQTPTYTPNNWKGFSINRTFRSNRYRITLKHLKGVSKSIKRVTLNNYIIPNKKAKGIQIVLVKMRN